MGKKREKEGSQKKRHSRTYSSSEINPLELKKIAKEEQITLARIKELVNLLKVKHKVSSKDILHLADEKEILIPVSIFTKKLSVLETLTKYLKEELSISYHVIGELLNRDERNIWHVYKNANKKQKTKIKIPLTKYFFPISIFQNKLSILENIVVYLKDELGLSYHEIAVLLERNDRTIWTMYNRAIKKKQ